MTVNTRPVIDPVFSRLTAGPIERRFADRHHVWFERRNKELSMAVSPKGERSTLKSAFWDALRQKDWKKEDLARSMLLRIRLVALRNQSGEMWGDVDDAIGWSRGTYGSFEVGRAMPQPTDIEELAVHFGVTLEYLVMGTGYPKL